MFCDVCGTKYENSDLRATSKYCMQCGETLPKLIVDALKGRQRSGQTEPIRQPSTSFHPRTQPHDGPIEPLGGDEEDLYGSPDTLDAMKPLQQGMSQPTRQNTAALLRPLQLSRRWTRITKKQTVIETSNQKMTTLCQLTTPLRKP
jgi:hypothetical protein